MLINPGASAELARSISENRETYCSRLFLSAKWFVLSQVAREGTHIVILPDKETAEYCSADLYTLVEGDNVFFFPEGGTHYERSSYKSSLGVQRTSALGRLMENKQLTFLITYPEALEEPIPDNAKIKGSTLSIKIGTRIGREALKEKLSQLGFERTDFVSMPGQYALRGSIVDIFSYSGSEPFRLSFFGDEVEKINIFDCNTQLSKGDTQQVEIIPDLISEGGECSVLDIVPKNTVLWLDSSDIYKERAFFGGTEGFKRVFIDTPLSSSAQEVKFDISPQPVFNKNFEFLTEDIRSKIEHGYKVYIYGEKQSQLDRLKSILYDNRGLMPEFISGKDINKGFIDNETRTCCYSDHEIFDRFHRVRIRRTVEKSEQLTLNDLSSFNIGDYIVHMDYGVGVFGGLVRIKDDKGRMHEVVKLTYKDGDVVFISVHSLHKISRYKSKDSLPPRINKIGSKTWQALKVSAKSKVKDIAKDLIRLYAKRKSLQGHAYSPDNYLQEELESSFMYEDTPDQVSSNAAVKRDMEDSSPMDRLICGDVGFGKTEIAVRAAFKAVCDSKQVAVLVPTTILALQHYNTFKERLKNFPCNVDYLCRLRTAKETSQIKKKLSSGGIDILIGTHKLFGKELGFKDLGLLIIDEEQKFGVAAKEKLRQLRMSVDTLTLTATPIPRTLQFSLLGARDLSIINTPPPNRIPVQTEVMLFDEKEIRSIVNYELNRGGQIFFIHNRVEELYAIHDILHRLVPDMKICVAHGQMESKELEGKMMEFIRGDYDMLLCTTIIENGLDIPSANTIIINQAQNFGLSDLHQLRGRVGRSNKKAFCYLIVPPLTTLTEESRRRLKAIEEFSDLGSGFNIAMQDLDIRGAGNLLGAEQSGFISDMGYETYQKILAEAMEEIGVETGLTSKNLKDSYVEDCTIDTDQVALIPDDYIDVTAEKIRIYKEMDSARRDEELDAMARRIEDRFGKMPNEVRDLFDIVRIRHIGERLGFEKIIIKNGIMIAFFISNSMSPYYRTPIFSDVLKSVSSHPGLFEMKQNDSKLRLISRNIGSIPSALAVLKKL